MQNAPRGASAILSTFMELPFVIKIFVLSILSGRFTHVLLYADQHIVCLKQCHTTGWVKPVLYELPP